MLSDKPSEALRQALNDLLKCELDGRYLIDMHNWVRVDDDQRTCSVCLAGAVIAQQYGPSVDFRDVIDHRHYGIDQFRAGRIWNGIACFRDKTAAPILGRAQRVEGVPEYFPVEFYDESPTQFKTDILQVITILEGVDL